MSERTQSVKRQLFVSTGHLPGGDRVQRLVEDAWQAARSNDDGQVSQVYPALPRVPRDLFGVSLVSCSGLESAAGESAQSFTIMSVSKPFVFALLCDGPEVVRQRVGVNDTGRAFNSLASIDASPDGLTNPMVNSGAIATTSLTPGYSMAEKWDFLLDGFERFAGIPLKVNEDVFGSASETNHRNRALANALYGQGRLYSQPDEAVDLYTRQCSLDVTAHDLAVMGATLANGGINPITGERVVSQMACHYTLAVMTIAGLYETSGDWLYDIGLPGKSGFGGGIVTVSPGKGGLGTFAPPLDSAGNSVKGQLVARQLSQSAGLDLFLAGSPD